MRQRADWFYRDLTPRRTVREFSPRPVPREVIEDCLRAAGTAPSGANLQPWHFVVVGDPEVKRRIRVGAEQEEHEPALVYRLPNELSSCTTAISRWLPMTPAAPTSVSADRRRLAVTQK